MATFNIQNAAGSTVWGIRVDGVFACTAFAAANLTHGSCAAIIPPSSTYAYAHVNGANSPGVLYLAELR